MKVRTLVLWMMVLCLPACGGQGPSGQPSDTLGMVETLRGRVTTTLSGAESAIVGRSRVEVGSRIATGDDARATLALDCGAWVLLDRESAVVPSEPTEPGSGLGAEVLTVEAGRAWIDGSQGASLVVNVGELRLDPHDASLAVSFAGGQPSVYVASGEVAYRMGEHEGTVAQGETLELHEGAPRLAPAALWDDWTGGLADPARGRFRASEPIGLLRGRIAHAFGEARTVLPVRRHDVRVRVDGDLAVTEVVQTFFNARSDVLEGEWGLRIPTGAVVQAFAVDVGNGFEEGVPTAFGLTSPYVPWWGEPSYTGVGQSRLIHDGGGRVRARVFPIAAGATVQVRLRYTEWLDRRGGLRTYTYAMRSDGEAPLLSELVIDIDATAANAASVRSGMGAVVEDGHVILRASDVRPHADLSVDFMDRAPVSTSRARLLRVETTAEDRAKSEVEGREAYVLVDVPTEDLAPAGADAPLDLVLVLDASGGTDAEDLEIARAVIESTLRQLAPADRVTLRLADVSARAPAGLGEGALEDASDATRERILGSIADVQLGGATDLGESLRQAAQLVAGRPRAAVLYLGDAVPTTGALDATALRRVLGTIESPPRFFGLAIGEGANADLLRALFGSAAVHVRDRDGAARAVLSMLVELAQPALRGVTVDLGEGVERVVPQGLQTVTVGQHVRLVGRLAGDLPETVRVRGHRDGQPFDVSLGVDVMRVDDGGDVRRRWAQSRLAELIDANAGREALVDLGLRFGLVTPWTSLAVGAAPDVTIPCIRSFDHDPFATEGSTQRAGWRRRMPSAGAVEATSPEQTWVRHSASGPTSGDGGLGQAAAVRVLREGERGVRQCYERRAIVRPDLRGQVTVSVRVAGAGGAESSEVVSSTLGDSDVERCVATEVRGLPFVGVGAGSVTVSHTFVFELPEREFGTRRTCSDAASLPVEERARLWRERLVLVAHPNGILAQLGRARAQCELPTWHARRAFYDLALEVLTTLDARVEFARRLGPDPAARGYVRAAILRSLRTPQQIEQVRVALGLQPDVVWGVFVHAYDSSSDASARLRLVRSWLAVAPEDLDLRLRLLRLLEETGGVAEARRLADSIARDTLADAKARTEVGEFWLRQGDEALARRVFSEIVEHAPYDPWARRRLGDLYRAHGWFDDAYREYQTLTTLAPDDEQVWLLQARAAAGAGRIDEALRIEERLTESSEPGATEGVAAAARVWSWLRLAEGAAGSDETARLARARLRQNGILRDPPALLVVLTMEHPEDDLTLAITYSDEEPAARTPAELGGVDVGLRAIPIRDALSGVATLHLHRADVDSLRESPARVTVLFPPAEHRAPVVEEVLLRRDRRDVQLSLSPEGALRVR